MFSSHDKRLKFGDVLMLVCATDTLMNAVLLCRFAFKSLQDKVLYIFHSYKNQKKQGETCKTFSSFLFSLFSFSFSFCLKKSGSRKRSFEVKVCTKHKKTSIELTIIVIIDHSGGPAFSYQRLCFYLNTTY